MATKIQHKRTNTAATVFPTLNPGELAFNAPQQKIAIGDPTTGAPIELIAVRFFSTASSYAINDFVTNSGTLLRAVNAVSPGTFNPSDWQGAADGLPEAPIDGLNYFRSNAGWVQATLGALGGVAEAPNDTKMYARKSAAWVQLDAYSVVYNADNVGNALDNKVDPGDLISGNITNQSTVSGTNVTGALNTLAASDALKAPLDSPALTGVPTVPTASPGTSTSQAASTAFATTAINLKANIASPTFTGVPSGPTAPPNSNTTQLSTTAYADAGLALKANLASPALTGVPTAPTPANGTNTTQLATAAMVYAAVPTGAYMDFAMVTAPPGWAECDGRSVLRADPIYAALFAVIGTVYGTVDGTHFTLPDRQGKFNRGRDPSNKQDPSGSTRGFGSTQVDAFQTHIHSATSSSGSSSSTSIAAAGAHAHNVIGKNNAASYAGPGANFNNVGFDQVQNIMVTDTQGNHAHTATTSTTTTTTTTIGAPTTGTTAAETRPTNICVLMCIKL